jgi:hypothetical protein
VHVFVTASLDVWTIFGATGSLIAILIGLVAIWQAWLSYRRSTASLREIKRAAEDVRSGVERIEQRVGQPGSSTREQTIRLQLTLEIERARQRGLITVRADDLLAPLFQRFQAEDVHNVLASLRGERVIDWQGEGDWVEEPGTPIYLAPPPGPPQQLLAA